MELGEDRCELVHHVSSRPVGEERSDPGRHTLMGRQLGVSDEHPQTLLDDFGGKGDELGEAIGPVGQAERLRWVR